MAHEHLTGQLNLMAMLPQSIQDTFDDILEAHIDALPPEAADLLEEAAIVVEDEPSEELLESLGMEPGDDLFGLHTGEPETERTVEDTFMLPTQINLFRGPIIRLAGYEVVNGREVNRDQLVEQIRITLLHEIGHQFGLDEDDLTELGYD